MSYYWFIGVCISNYYLILGNASLLQPFSPCLPSFCLSCWEVSFTERYIWTCTFSWLTLLKISLLLFPWRFQDNSCFFGWILTVYMIIRCLMAEIVIAGYYFSSYHHNHYCSSVSSFYDSQVSYGLLCPFGNSLEKIINWMRTMLR